MGSRSRHRVGVSSRAPIPSRQPMPWGRSLPRTLTCSDILAPMPTKKKKAPAKKATTKRAKKAAPTTRPTKGNTQPIETQGPQFAQMATTPDPTAFATPHASDAAAYKILDSEKNQN